MNSRNIIIVAVAVFIGLLAVYLGNVYFSGVAERNTKATEQVRMTRVVVAVQELSFGTSVTPQNVRLANWPVDSVPQGAFTTIADATKDRVALRPIAVGEPILASKVSGTGGRATLSANLPEGLFAFTIPIGAVSGVAGFVRPGDVVDVLLTRPIPATDEKATEVVLRAVPVLGIDQVADDKQTKPAVGHTATLQVSMRDAQKLALATKVGAIDLALRNVADQSAGRQPTVTSRDLTPGRNYFAARAAPPTAPGSAQPRVVFKPRRTGPTMTVVRGLTPSEYEVRRGF